MTDIRSRKIANDVNWDSIKLVVAISKVVVRNKRNLTKYSIKCPVFLRIVGVKEHEQMCIDIILARSKFFITSSTNKRYLYPFFSLEKNIAHVVVHLHKL